MSSLVYIFCLLKILICLHIHIYYRFDLSWTQKRSGWYANNTMLQLLNTSFLINKGLLQVYNHATKHQLFHMYDIIISATAALLLESQHMDYPRFVTSCTPMSLQGIWILHFIRIIYLREFISNLDLCSWLGKICWSKLIE